MIALVMFTFVVFTFLVTRTKPNIDWSRLVVYVFNKFITKQRLFHWLFTPPTSPVNINE